MKLHHYDLTITYKAGDELGFIKPNTQAGRDWLIDHHKGLRVNGRAMADPQELLTMLMQFNHAELTANWIDK